eukprot:g9814.t1
MADTSGFHLRRERHAEKLRRSFEAFGREQNSMFESLAEYTHEMQAEVRALQIARDRLNAEQLRLSDEDLSASHPAAPARLGKPLVSDRWVSFEAAAIGVFSCGLLGFLAGFWGWRQGTVVRALVPRKGSKRQRRLHAD